MIPQNNKISYDEFLKISEDKRAEYINGEMFLMTTPSFYHQEIILNLAYEFKNYFSEKDCKPCIAPFDIILKNETEKHRVQPDISIICNQDLKDQNEFEGVPSLIVEVVSPSNASHDFIRKMNLYMKFGVQEYWIVEPKLNAVRIYKLVDGFYDEVIIYTKDEILKSNLFKDLRINLEYIF